MNYSQIQIHLFEINSLKFKIDLILNTARVVANITYNIFLKIQQEIWSIW